MSDIKRSIKSLINSKAMSRNAERRRLDSMARSSKFMEKE
jgi:hypothetical protein